jgi:hypothetical protein
MQSVSAPVAEPARTREDRFEPSGQSPRDAGMEDVSASGTGDDAPARAGATEARDGGSGSRQLSDDERRMVNELQARDREVRAHEAAHQAAGGGHVGGASYTYQQGPDGRQYAVGGEVPVDLSTGGGSPEAVIAKMAQVRAAAMAPADPSAQDFAVAAAAAAIQAAARQQQQAERGEKAEAGDPAAAGAVQDPAIDPTGPAARSGDDRRDDPAADRDAGATASSAPSATAPTAGGDQDGTLVAARALGAYRAASAAESRSALVDSSA